MNLLILEEKRLIRDAFRALLATQGEHRVVAEAGTIDEACAAVHQRVSSQVDVALVDAESMNGEGLDVVRRLRRLRPAPKVLMLAPARDDMAIAAALHAGASGCIFSEASATMLLDAIRAVGRGETWLPPSVSRFELDAHAARLREAQHRAASAEEGAPASPKAPSGGEPHAASAHGAHGHAAPVSGPLAPLTPREREVFHLLVAGEGNHEIALRFSLSVKTVETHRARILRKLGVHDMAGLVRLAARHGLLS